MSGTLKVGGVPLATHTGTDGLVTGMSWGSSVPSGTILQVQYTQLTTNTSQVLSADTSTAITSLTVDITPRLTGSIIKLESYLFGEMNTANTPNGSASFFYRDSTKIANTEGTPANRIIGIGITNISYYQEDRDSTPESWTTTFFDTPTIPSTPVKITYKLGFESNADSNLYINRSVADADANYVERGCSFISATEIKG